jgi:hypothetical protein
MDGERMPCSPHRAIGEYDGVGCHADQRQLSTLQARPAGVHDDQRRFDFRPGLANRLLQRHVWRRGWRILC